ncbi:hypothetical protein OSB04_015099 [Centaurea solstitialis]|uniref:PGG domain-containing protein n=1 Tax=Centaurea solstitialis TaxID=347529 RepID=A0AA38SYC4_9ASTR|nr:hypothetical protein OSB04_015099 [Centaurea solstitialis]
MAASSPQIEDFEYLYASNANFSNFVSVKLSGKHNYHLWKTQMLCLMETHDMRGLVDAEFDRPRALSTKIIKQYDSLLKGWIFGSVSEVVLGIVINLDSPKAVWDELKSLYEVCSADHVQPTMTSQQGPEEIETESESSITIDIKAGEDLLSKETETVTEKEEARLNRKLLFAIGQRSWWKIKKILEKDREAWKKPLPLFGYGEAILRVVVRMGHSHNDLVEKLLRFLKKEQIKEILEHRDSNGRTVLHVAASVGNKHAVKLLIDKHNDLLTILDKEGQDPLMKALDSMEFDTFAYLLKVAIDNNKTKQLVISQGPDYKQKGASLVANAITAKQYSTALKLIREFPEFAVENDEVLMAIARAFPDELNYWETLIYPRTFRHMYIKVWFSSHSLTSVNELGELWEKSMHVMGGHDHLVLRVPVFTVLWVFGLMIFLKEIAFCTLHLSYLLVWKVLVRLVPHIKHIQKKKKVLEDARDVLWLVCSETNDLTKLPATHHPHYDRPILEAAVQNAYRVFDEIFWESREIRKSKNKNGYDCFQLAVIYRSENIYNILYQIGEDKNHYRTIKDSSENSMLHLAARSAPSHVLQRITGAALQLQRELQWFEELKKFMHPSDITKHNIHGETPPEMFTRAHEKLVKEGETWMKTTAESCSISAALITTIVFAAAITVPGGSNQETGIPMFRKDTAFTIFAISDAISLFTSTSSLMVFLSILTARFAEKDFLFILPKRLIIGLCTLLISIAAMMVAYGATLYLLFSREKQWMIGPICGFSCLPILFFVSLQFPLIADLYRSTYVPIFRKREDHFI